MRSSRTADGEEALLLAQERTPDLVILDWMIEGVTGIEVCRRLRRKGPTAARADHHADRARRGDGPHPRPGNRRRRLCHQALQPARAGGAGRRGAAPGAARLWPASSSTMPTSRWMWSRTGCAAPASRCSSGRPNSGCCATCSNIPAGSFRASGCSTRCGRTTRHRARTVDVHVRRLRKAINAAAARHHPHRPLGRLRARRRGVITVTKVKPRCHRAAAPGPKHSQTATEEMM